MSKGLERKIEHYSHDKPEYECFWGDGYRGADGRAILAYNDVDFFTEDRGYEAHDIEDIQQLKVGEAINLSCVTGEHWVQRIK